MNRYAAILVEIFRRHYQPGIESFEFERSEIGEVANFLGLNPPKNYGDLLYYFRFRQPMPKFISDTAPNSLG